ncbi:MAG: hypothetical protein ACRDD2_02125 [Sarcina sp.]
MILKKNKKRNKYKENILIGVVLISISLILFYLQCFIFDDLQHTLSLLFTNIAFIPMNIFFTAFVIENLIEKRNTHHKMEKLLMIKGVFFSEFGSELLEKFAKHDESVKKISDEAHINKNWSSQEFKQLNKTLDNHNFEVNIENLDLEKLSILINKKNNFLLSIITNPTLMEHESFSDMTIALFHLKEELQDIYINTDSICCDKEHIKQDIKVLYRLMAKSWASYMKHLKEEYPTLFVKAMTHNPFYKMQLKRNFNI